jgi:periplasmic protein TonB
MKTLIAIVLLGFGALFSPAAARSQDTTSQHMKPGTTGSDRYDGTFWKVEIESEFPGGTTAWLQFLQNHLVYPKKAVRKRIEGTVLLQFIVGKDGSISDVQALSGDPLLVEAALKAMAESPRWTPARQNGRAVKSYKKQPIVFRLVPA